MFGDRGAGQGCKAVPVRSKKNFWLTFQLGEEAALVASHYIKSCTIGFRLELIVT